MYHFMRGFVFSGGVFCSSIFCPPVLCAPMFCPATGSPASAFWPTSGLPRGMFQHPADSVANPQIEDPKIQREQKDSNDHHRGGGPHFLHAGKGDFPHFVADIGDKARGPGGNVPQPASSSPIVARHGCYLGHSTPAFFRQSLFLPITLAITAFAKTSFPPIIGRGGGIRTPKSGFGDRQF